MAGSEDHRGSRGLVDPSVGAFHRGPSRQDSITGGARVVPASEQGNQAPLAFRVLSGAGDR